MGKDTRLVDYRALEDFTAAVFAKSGMGKEDAQYCAEALVLTNLWGIDSHGVLRLEAYFRRLQKGAMNPGPDIRQIKGAMGFEVLDGDDGIGFLTARAAMERAIELAGNHSIGAAGVIKSNHCGAAALYARLAAAKGMIGIAMTNVVPNMVVPGGSRPITGNNPIAIAIPTFGDFPFVLDISMSAVAGGKLILASKKKEKIPLDWATDKDGRPTDDPDKGFAGFLLPMGGHKGFGLSLVVDILCGVITGGAFQDHLKGMYKYPDDPSLTGHFMLALNPLVLMSREDLEARMAEFYQTIKDSPMWDGSKEMFMPGEIEYRTAEERMQKGIPLPVTLFEDFQSLARELGLDTPLAEKS
ncbi:Ldh family oxidoreductase [Thermodesulfobacteriota bacterium]